MASRLLTLKQDYLYSAEPEELVPDSIELAMTALAMDSDAHDVSPSSPDHVSLPETDFSELQSTGYYEYVETVAHILECDNPVCAEGNARETKAFADACREQVERIHIPLSRRLLVRAYEGNLFAKEVYRLWKRLIDIFDITESGIRDKWRREGECWNPWCSTRGEKNVKTKRCSKCREIRYCSTACQKAYVTIYLCVAARVTNASP